MRALNRELSSLTRRYNLTNRELSAWHNTERSALRTSYEVALRNSRRSVTTRPVVVERHVEVSPVLAHPADCSCNVCNPVPVIETPTYRGTGRYDDGYGSSRYDRGYTPVGYGRSTGGMDIAGLILSLIN